MKIKEIKIKGWRSFDHDKGVVLTDLRQINIIIGPNNSGKSNIGKYFLFLKQVLGPTAARIGSNPQPNKYADYSTINHDINTHDTWAWLKNNISCLFTLDCQKSNWLINEPFYPRDKKDSVKLSIYHKINERQNIFSLLVDGDRQHLNTSKNTSNPEVYDFELSEYTDYTNHIKGLTDSFLYWHKFYESLVFIDPIRHHERQPKEKLTDFYFEGSNVLTKLSEISKYEIPLYRKFERDINLWLRELLNEEIRFRLEIGELRFIVFREKEEITANLEQLGTGVAQLFMLFSYLFINQDKELNVFIDEPEANLHPEAVKKMVRIFETNFSNHTFFITTHSSVLIDQVNDNWSIHRVIRKKEEPTEILQCNSIIHKYEALDDLGIRASQLLQTNLVIWVEGPSDKIYLKKWISDIAAEQGLQFKEGEHYSFLMYGGSNINSHTILSEDSDDYFDILCTSRYAIIVCDCDYENEEDAKKINKMKPRLEKILARLEELKQVEVGKDKRIDDYVKFWITQGRETENYVPKELFTELLTNSTFKRSSIEVIEASKKNQKKLVIDRTLIANKNFGKYDAFDFFFAEMYKFDNGQELNSSNKKNIATSYSSKKVELSKEVVKLWKTEYYNILDLRSEVESIVSLIRTASGM